MVYTEREALRESLSEIRLEKQELRKMYRDMCQVLNDRETKLLARLRELDDRDIDFSEAPGVYDIQGLLSDLSNTIIHLKELVPQVPVQVLIDEVRKSEVRVLEETEKGVSGNKVFKEEVLESVARENKSKGINAVERDSEKEVKIKYSSKKAAPVVKDYLEKAGIPVSLKTLDKVLDSAGFGSAVNPTSRLKGIIKVDPRIQQVTKGYYQFVK